MNLQHLILFSTLLPISICNAFSFSQSPSSNSMKVRKATKKDTARIKHVAVQAGMFTAQEVDEFLGGMLESHFEGTLEGHEWFVIVAHNENEDDNGDDVLIKGAVNYAPEPYSDGLYNMYFLGVDPSFQRQGVGSKLVAHVQDTLRASQDARVLLVDTSSKQEYDGARSFYTKMGFDEEARIREFYGPGDHKVTYWKSMQ